MINICDAKAMAQAAALIDLEGIYFGSPDQVLDSRVEEAENCWMFFQDSAIKVPPERSLSVFAYAVAKSAGLGARCVPDYRGDESRLSEYLTTISEYFGSQTAENQP